MADGVVTLWDANKILKECGGITTAEQTKVGKGCVSAANIHNGTPVCTIEFNPHKKNLLASGGAEVLI